MTEANKIDLFKKRLYDEFEDHAYKVLGVSSDRVREVLGERGHDIDADFEAAYEFAGAAFMRHVKNFEYSTAVNPTASANICERLIVKYNILS